MAKLIRLDKLLVDKKLAETKLIAQSYIKLGRVYVNGIKSDAINRQVSPDMSIKLDLQDKKWVSRGALKLLKALDKFKVVPENKVCIDIGASTGGFTDVLLTKKAKCVYAVDVGYGQLAWKLQNHPKVYILDRTNAKFLTTDMLDNQKVDIIVLDVSFISVTKLLLPLEKLLKEEGEMIILLKPQFEANKDEIKKGIITEQNIHSDIIKRIIFFINKETKLSLIDATHSPIKGHEGNIEFLLYLRKENTQNEHYSVVNITQLVENAHIDV